MAVFYRYDYTEITKNIHPCCLKIKSEKRTVFLQASYNSEEPQLAGSLSSASGGGGGVSLYS